ncbi:hypothetical protein LPJ79_000581 [Coemansia sp. RSA 1821]|nr:hypothetical protein BX667DRAFT_498320 [Coemansia mojavensis]KAJ1753128.1 hypothetical protein LPJ79_000581 [Coemansia sp. RSA 1821]
MSSQIAQVEGCEFSTEELQLFHRYYKYDWTAHGLESASVNQRIDHFVSAVDLPVDTARLRSWLRTMGIIDESEKSDEAKLYDRFEQYDFAAAPGFNQMLAHVYDTSDVTKYAIDERMDRAKAQYYNDHVEPLEYEKYREFKIVNAPKPVCPYQDLWDSKGTDKEAADTLKFANVKTIDIAEFLGSQTDQVLTVDVVNRMLDAVKLAYDQKYFAVALVNSQCSRPEPMFLPALDKSPENSTELLKAAMRLRIELQNLNKTKPVIIFANGMVDASALGLLLCSIDIVTSEMFCVSCSPTQATYPFISLYDWACLSDRQSKVAKGTAEYILCNPHLVLRSAEWNALDLGIGFVSHRKFATSMEKILMAASCPPPHTRDALRKACAVESMYPGPSKINVWANEIQKFFAPLAEGKITLLDLTSQLQKVEQPWAGKYLAFANTQKSMDIANARVSGMQAARSLQYSQALAMELSASIMWSQGVTDPDVLFSSPPLLTTLLDIESIKASNTHKEVSGECPFARMYRKNPERFKNVDLKSIADHRSLNL